MNPIVIKTLLATAGITDPALVEFVCTLIASSEDVKQETVSKSEAASAIDHASDPKCVKISGVVKGEPMLAFLVLTK